LTETKQPSTKTPLFSQKKLFAFDVDNTISKSRQPIDAEMANLLKKLLETKKVAIITGGAFADIKKQVLDPLGKSEKCNKNLILLPTNGGSMWICDEVWKEISSHNLLPAEKEKIIKALQEVDQADPELCDNKSYGREIQDRETEISYAAWGENAPLEIKRAWDPDLKKRVALQAKLMEKLPEFEVKIGGTTSIDITPKGMDKAYAIKEVVKYLNYNLDDVLFFGDAVYQNGNDYPVFELGAETIKVINPEETKERLIRLIAERT
jgi:HAD superfamily hydrolase (TIGR01484 family)